MAQVLPQSSPQQVCIGLYTMRGGAPPYRGYKLSRTNLTISPRPTTVAELLQAVIEELDVDHGNVRFYAAPGGSALPHAFEVGEGFVEVNQLMNDPLDKYFPGTTSLVVRLGWAPGMADIGVYTLAHEESMAGVVAGAAPGAVLLSKPQHRLEHAATVEEIMAMVAEVKQHKKRAPATGSHLSHGEVEVVPEEARSALIALVEAAWRAREDGLPLAREAANEVEAGVLAGSVAQDYKLLLTEGEAKTVLGDEAYSAVLRALGDGNGDRAAEALVVRRTEATGRWIGFHTDNAARTVQVPLTGEDACVGGRLVFALDDGRLEVAKRVPGAMLVHDGDVVHGVTALTQGVRYSFYALRGRGVGVRA